MKAIHLIPEVEEIVWDLSPPDRSQGVTELIPDMLAQTQSSSGNYYDPGFDRAIREAFRVGADHFRRTMSTTPTRVRLPRAYERWMDANMGSIDLPAAILANVIREGVRGFETFFGYRPIWDSAIFGFEDDRGAFVMAPCTPREQDIYSVGRVMPIARVRNDGFTLQFV